MTAQYFANKALMYAGWGFPEEAEWCARQMHVSLGAAVPNRQVDVMGHSPYASDDYCPYCGTSLDRRDNYSAECTLECYEV